MPILLATFPRLLPVLAHLTLPAMTHCPRDRRCLALLDLLPTTTVPMFFLDLAHSTLRPMMLALVALRVVVLRAWP